MTAKEKTPCSKQITEVKERENKKRGRKRKQRKMMKKVGENMDKRKKE